VRHRSLTRGLAGIAAAAAVGALAYGRPWRGAAPPPTFTRDIAPIVFTNCTPCHRPGQAVPFSLLTYADAVKHAGAIADETRQRHMPPWLPDHGEFAILGERRLTSDQIATIQQWARGDRLEGRPDDLPKIPVFPDGWQLGAPDRVLTLATPYRLQPGTEDVYRDLVIRSPVPANVFVRAVEFRTNGAPIHHAVIRVDRTGASRAHDGLDGQPGFNGMSWPTVQDPDGQFIGWAPGRGPIVSPDGMPWRLNRGDDLVVELHMLAAKKPAVVSPVIALFTTATPPVRTPLTVKMGSKLIDIPAGATDYEVTDTYELPVPVTLLSVYPHAHYLGKDMRVTATWPGGETKTLLHIPHWSFHWQQDYRYATPIPLPRGTVVKMRYTYDNSEANEDNPHTPPVRVRVGPNSTDEMAELGLQVLTESVADSARLARAFGARDAQANVAAGEMRVREAPESAAEQAFLGNSYVEVGRYADALPHLEAALRLDPKHGSAESDLGAALMGLDRMPEALVHLQRGAALSPRDETIHFNLGKALARVSRPSEAAAAYERALALNPEFAPAHVNYGTLLFTQGRLEEALPHMQRAASLLPDSAVVHSNYASVLAASGRYADALAETRRALELDPDYAPARENMARLESMGIR